MQSMGNFDLLDAALAFGDLPVNKSDPFAAARMLAHLQSGVEHLDGPAGVLQWIDDQHEKARSDDPPEEGEEERGQSAISATFDSGYGTCFSNGRSAVDESIINGDDLYPDEDNGDLYGEAFVDNVDASDGLITDYDRLAA